MMIVGFLASRTTLASKLIQDLIIFIGRAAQQDAKESGDLPWLRLSVMTIICLVQSQSIRTLPKKCLEILKEIRDLAGLLEGLSKEFKIEKFLSVYLEALVDYSSSDDSCCFALITTIETVHIKDLVVNVVMKVLHACMKLSQSMENSKLHESGSWAKQILVVIDKRYPTELRGAVHTFLEDPKMNSMLETLCLMLDGNLDMPTEITYSKVWFALEHPKAEVRRATLSALALSGILDAKAIEMQNTINVQEAMLRRLHDDDLTVVQAVLSLDGLAGIVNPSYLLQAFQDILSRCVDILIRSTGISSEAFDVAVLCLEKILNLKQHQIDFSKVVAIMMFPLLLILPKTWMLNIRALDLVKEIKWPFFDKLYDANDLESTLQAKLEFTMMQKFEPSYLTSLNRRTVRALAESFVMQPGEYMPWLIECCSSSNLSKPLFLLVILQSFILQKEDFASLSTLFQVCFPVLKNEYCKMESDVIPADKFVYNKLDKVCSGILDRLLNPNHDYDTLNSTILVCILWSMLEAYTTISIHDTSADFGKWLVMLQDLFVFFATTPLKHAYKEYLHLLVMKSGISPVRFLCKFFTEEGFPVVVEVASLHSFETICLLFASSKKEDANSSGQMQLLCGLPLLLVPLSSNNQDIRMSAVNCIEALYKLWSNISHVKNENGIVLEPFFGEFLELIVDHRTLISSDVNLLPSLLTSVLGSSSHSLLMPQNIGNRFDQRAKEEILRFILSYSLKFSPYGKLMVLSLLKGMGNAIMRVEEVKILLYELLERRSQNSFGVDRSSEPLSKFETDTLCLLLESCIALPGSAQFGDITTDSIFKSLQVDDVLSKDPSIIQPCVTVLKNLTSALYSSLKTDMQDKLFRDLVILFRNDNGDIQNAATEALLRINVSSSTIGRLLDLILVQEDFVLGYSKRMKRKKSTKRHSFDLHHDLSVKGETLLSFLSSMLDVLLQKKDIESRVNLVEPLFKLLGQIFRNKWLSGFIDEHQIGGEESSDISRITGLVCDIPHTIFMILEDISASFSSDCLVKDGTLMKFDVNLLVECARSAKDVTTRNHVFLLLSSISKLNPDQVLDHIIDIFTVIGESAIMQSDSHSQRVFEDLISTVVPCWLLRTNKAEKLLQIFVDVMPEVAEHRRLTLMVYLLRTLGEKSSLGALLVLLFRSLAMRMSEYSSYGSVNTSASQSAMIHREWEYVFAVQLCEQYSCTIWLPSLVMLLKETGIACQHHEQMTELLFTVQFILHKLQDTELSFKLEAELDPVDVQETLGTLMEQVVSHLQLITVRTKQLNTPTSVKKELKGCMHTILLTITKSMTPTAYFKAITLLLGHADRHVRKKALGILCETVKGYDVVQHKYKGTRKLFRNFNSGLHMDETARECFNKMCLEIVHLVDSSISSSNSDAPVKLAAISALEVLANKFSSNNTIFVTCLSSVAKHIDSDDLAVSSSCLRSAGALINVLGPKALPELSYVMEHMLKRAHKVSSCSARKFKEFVNSDVSGLSSNKESLLLSILVALEAAVDKLGGFLNPYLEDIVELLVLHLEYVSESDAKLKSKADSLRRLVTEKIPVRLVLTPLFKIYAEAVKCGESSVSVAFEMLATAISTMDKSSIGSYNARIFEQCLLALDLRRQHPVSVTDIGMVEESVIHAVIVLTMKLTETLFRPIFIRCLEWAESGLDESELSNRNLDRPISFFKLVSRLAEQHRSLFVPYFKYLLEVCTRYLTDNQDQCSINSIRKRKKAKVLGADSNKETKGDLSPSQWHLRALILLSLHKCFLYDSGSTKFLDSSNFQVLLKPIVSQLVAEPPATPESSVPSVNEVDDILVSCLGQMAVTAGSDLLWKPLNHEVLMQTRSGKLRSQILSLRVVKYLVEHLKEEYVVLLPETIPFLGELLEDVNLPVRTMAQEILKELETLSGEDLKQYLN
eukprot:TRINITY_DN22456_c0_g2_i1.p1 TRINITY_DN22456_c0_g2~~TRINITY_DN22456_c0_g2_i1.p1  ORF type:complete len:2020 (-),score=349.41 TRINITY_DN22456_c0_g2_i1:339-6095(-)